LHEANLQTVLDVRQGGSMGVQGMTGQKVSALQVLRHNQASSIKLIPFRAAHIFEIVPDADDETYKMAWRAQESGVGYTAYLHGLAIGCAGLSIQRPGIGEAWTYFTPLLRRVYPLTMHRLVKTLLDKHAAKLDEVYAACKPENEKWLMALGFKYVPREACKYPEAFSKLTPDMKLMVRAQ